MGVKISAVAISEIIRNPNDLQINIFYKEEGCGFTIARRATRKMSKVLVDGMSTDRPKKEAIEHVRKILQHAKALAGDCDIATDLTKEMIDKICNDLTETSSARTFSC